MAFEKENMDIILVPAGFAIMLGYHLFLLYRIIKLPQTTVIGYENHNKRAWVERMMKAESTDVGLALAVISSNISAATFLSSMSITLCSLIGAWVGGSNNIFSNVLIYGNTSSTTIAVKYISILSCFLVAFVSFVQSARSFVHANFLISTPNTDMPVKYVQSAVIRGSNFWSLGLRALYFATTLLLWIYGPIPMFVCSVITVAILHLFDSNSTPLHPYHEHLGTRLVKKVGEEMSAVVRAIEQHTVHNVNIESTTIGTVQNTNIG